MSISATVVNGLTRPYLFMLIFESNLESIKKQVDFVGEFQIKDKTYLVTAKG